MTGEAKEEMDALMNEVMLWIGDPLGGPDELSLDEVLLIRKGVVWYTAWLLEPANRDRLLGMLGRAGFDPFDTE